MPQVIHFVNKELRVEDQQTLVKDKLVETALYTEQDYASQHGRSYCPYQVVNGSLNASTGLSAGTLRAIPFRLTKKALLKEIALYVVGGTLLSQFQMGLYDSNSDAGPGVLRWQSGDIPLASINTAYTVAGLEENLPAGLYYLACMTNSAVPMSFRGLTATMQAVLLGYLSASSANPINRVEKTGLPYVHDHLPNPFPSAPSYVAVAGFSPEAYFIKTELLAD